MWLLHRECKWRPPGQRWWATGQLWYAAYYLYLCSPVIAPERHPFKGTTSLLPFLLQLHLRVACFVRANDGSQMNICPIRRGAPWSSDTFWPLAMHGRMFEKGNGAPRWPPTWDPDPIPGRANSLWVRHCVFLFLGKPTRWKEWYLYLRSKGAHLPEAICRCTQNVFTRWKIAQQVRDTWGIQLGSCCSCGFPKPAIIIGWKRMKTLEVFHWNPSKFTKQMSFFSVSYNLTTSSPENSFLHS